MTELASKTTFGIIGGELRLYLLVGQRVGARRALDSGENRSQGVVKDCGRSMLLMSFPTRWRRSGSPSASAASGVTGISTITVSAISLHLCHAGSHMMAVNCEKRSVQKSTGIARLSRR